MGFSRQEYWSGLPFSSPIHIIKNIFTLFFRSLLLKRLIISKKHYQLIVVVVLYHIISNNTTTAKKLPIKFNGHEMLKCSLAGSQLIFSACISSLAPKLWFPTLCWFWQGSLAACNSTQTMGELADRPSGPGALIIFLLQTAEGARSPNACVWAHCAIRATILHAVTEGRC